MITSLSSPTRPLRIGFLCPHNPFDRRAFSGTAFYAYRALAAHPQFDMHILGNHRRQSLAERLLKRASSKCEQASPEDLTGLDAVLGLVGSKLIAPLMPQLTVPYIHVTDATPAFLRDCYGWNIPVETDRREAWIAKSAAAAIYSSHEMAEQAAREFDTLTTAIPFGINMDHLPTCQPAKPELDRANLLFVGNDWARKGGDIAISALTCLRARGVDAHLTVIGRLPEAYRGNPAITALGYLDKNRPRQAARLAAAYAEAHILILPTRADCTPMVAAEAMAHGTPVIGTDIGGMGTLLGGPGTGKMMPPEASGEDWANAVHEIIGNRAVYQALSDAAFDRAGTRLSWDRWAGEVVRVVDRLCALRRNQSRISAAA